jgi:putative colanic acid biosysnthesis UDP-glucose lipid carrier transferase
LSACPQRATLLAHNPEPMARPLLKPHAATFAAVLRLVDPACALAAGAVAFAVYPPTVVSAEHYLVLLAAGAIAIGAIFPAFRLYDTYRGASLASELRDLTLAWTTLGALVAGALFLAKMGEAFSRVWVGLWLVLGFVLAAAARIVVRLTLRHWRRRGRNLRHVAIVGAGALGERVARVLAEAPWTGFNVVGFYDDEPSLHGRAVAGRPVFGPADLLATDVETRGFDQVWLALPLRAERRVHAILDLLRNSAAEVCLVPDIFGFHLLNHSFSEVAGLPVLSLTATPMAGSARVAKAIEDRVLGAIALVVAAPVMALVALGVKVDSPGPVLYRQQRVTWNGVEFAMLKFRTMPVAAEAQSGAVWSRHGESRATAFGRLLRRFSLDELPQLFNVLKGDMSLVGPRPERPEFVAQFRAQIPGYMQKHLVKAGITGWAQVHDLRGDSDLARRIQYDLYYVEHWSLGFDLRILGLTLWHILTSRNAH